MSPPPSRKRVTIRDVARFARVSHQTVSRFINGENHIAPLTRDAGGAGDRQAPVPSEPHRPQPGEPADEDRRPRHGRRGEPLLPGRGARGRGRAGGGGLQPDPLQQPARSRARAPERQAPARAQHRRPHPRGAAVSARRAGRAGPARRRPDGVPEPRGEGAPRRRGLDRLAGRHRRGRDVPGRAGSPAHRARRPVPERRPGGQPGRLVPSRAGPGRSRPRAGADLPGRHVARGRARRRPAAPRPREPARPPPSATTT